MLLSPRSYNYLLINGYTEIHQIAFLGVDDFMSLPRMEFSYAEEITRCLRRFLEEKRNEILLSLKESQEEVEGSQDKRLRNILHSEKNHNQILQFV